MSGFLNIQGQEVEGQYARTFIYDRIIYKH